MSFQFRPLESLQHNGMQSEHQGVRVPTHSRVIPSTQQSDLRNESWASLGPAGSRNGLCRHDCLRVVWRRWGPARRGRRDDTPVRIVLETEKQVDRSLPIGVE